MLTQHIIIIISIIIIIVTVVVVVVVRPIIIGYCRCCLLISVHLYLACRYWDGFHSCATTALADCQEGATDLWEKLKKQSRNLEYPGSLFELCGGGNGASASPVPFGLALLLTAFSTLVTWFAF